MTVLDGLRRHPVPAALGAAAVLLQILYPLVQGPGRDRLTVVTVVSRVTVMLAVWSHSTTGNKYGLLTPLLVVWFVPRREGRGE